MPTILTVIGTRPEAIKLAPVVTELSRHPDVVSRVCVTAQHREMTDQILRLWGIAPDHDLDVMTPGQTLTDVTSGVLTRLAPILERERPDWVLVQGDTTTAMAAGLCAFYHRIPVGHVEAGLRTYDTAHPFPEEVNRRITAITARWHFAPTPWAADNLRNEGVDPRTIVVTGNTVIDALRYAVELGSAMGGPLDGVPADGRRIVLVTCHRRENLGANLRQICSALAVLVGRNPDVRLVVPVHPNPQVSGPVQDLLGGIDRVTLLPAQDYLPMMRLLAACHLVITDSGGLQEEATGVAKPVLVLRSTTERPEGVEAGTARLVGADPSAIVHWAEHLLHDPEAYRRMARATSPYGSGTAASAIVDVLRRGAVDATPEPAHLAVAR